MNPTRKLHTCTECRTAVKLPYDGATPTWCATCKRMTPHTPEDEQPPAFDISAKLAALEQRLRAKGFAPKPIPPREDPAIRLRRAGYPARAIDGIAKMSGPGATKAFAALELLRARPDAHLVIGGPNGRGKTQLATWLAAQRIDEDKSPGRYVSVPELAETLKGDMARNFPQDERIAPLIRTPFLVLDEAQDMGRTDWLPQTLRHIADCRYRNFLPAIFLLNVANEKEMETKLGARIADRAHETGGSIFCDWPSYRS